MFRLRDKLPVPAWGRLVLGLMAVLLLLTLALPAADGAGTGAGSWPAWVPIALSVVDLVIVAVLSSRGHDVRMLLLLGALPLFAATGGLPAMIVKIAAAMTSAGTVVPICSAMGFAFVLKLTECDQHLVRLLVRPLRENRMLLVPGGIGAGYLINTTIVSQAGTAAVLGPILIPLLRAGGLGSISAGAILLLGSSMGGELFNPGSVEMRKLSELTGVSSAQVVGQSARLNLMACGTAAAVFWLLSMRRRENQNQAGGADAGVGKVAVTAVTGSDRIDVVKAIIPMVPIVLLALDAAFGVLSVTGVSDGPAKILAAMLIGVVAAGLTSFRTSGGIASAFFDGAGYAYSHVISLIVAASTFAEGVRLSGLIEMVIRALVSRPAAAMVAAAAAPWGLAFVSGTGIAPAIAIMEFFVPAAARMGIDPVLLGTITALSAHFGRTMSPAAAVVMISARLADAGASELIRRVAVPLLMGGAVLLGGALVGSL